MSAVIVRGEDGLQAPPIDGSGVYPYIRSKAEPRVLIASRNGVVYEREDGERWAHPAYRVWTDSAGRRSVTTHPAYCDGEQYGYATVPA